MVLVQQDDGDRRERSARLIAKTLDAQSRHNLPRAGHRPRGRSGGSSTRCGVRRGRVQRPLRTGLCAAGRRGSWNRAAVACSRRAWPQGGAVMARFRTPPELLRYMVVKDPVIGDGASLTIIDKTVDSFAVSPGAGHAGAHQPVAQATGRIGEHRDRHHCPLRRDPLAEPLSRRVGDSCIRRGLTQNASSLYIRLRSGAAMDKAHRFRDIDPAGSPHSERRLPPVQARAPVPAALGGAGPSTQLGAGAPACVPPKPKLLDQVRDAIRTRHYSYRTEAAGARGAGRRRMFIGSSGTCSSTTSGIRRRWDRWRSRSSSRRWPSTGT